MSQSSNHLRLVSWTWHFTQMASTITWSQSKRAPLGCGGREDLHHGCAADKSAATAWCYHVNIDQNLRGMFPTPCWICATKNYGSSEGKRRSNPVLATSFIHSFIHSPFKGLGSLFIFLFFVHCFQNKVSYAHQGCIYLSQNMVKQYCEILFY